MQAHVTSRATLVCALVFSLVAYLFAPDLVCLLLLLSIALFHVVLDLVEQPLSSICFSAWPAVGGGIHGCAFGKDLRACCFLAAASAPIATVGGLNNFI